MKPQFKSLVVLIASATAQTSPPPSNIRIGAVSYSGSGCPQGSVTSMLADSKDIVTFGFDKFQATIGPGSSPGSTRKNCNLNLQLIFGEGFQMAVAETVYHGYTRLDDGVNAKFTTDYSYRSDPNPPKKVFRILDYNLVLHTNDIEKGHTESSLDGEAGEHRGKNRKGKEFNHNHKHEQEHGLVWSKCGKDEALIVENYLVLSSRNQTASGEFAVDDETVKFQHKMTLKWKKCK
jgi:hypothetical protein